MPIETTDQLTGLLASAALKARLAVLEGIAPKVGLALNLELDEKDPVLFANLTMPIENDGSVANAETLAHLRIDDMKLQMSVLIDRSRPEHLEKRNELIMAALQVLDFLDREVSVPAAA